jgi:hypothetical protein
MLLIAVNLGSIAFPIVMDLVTAVIVCNCAISIGCLVLVVWTIRFRRQVVALANWCDRWSVDCDLLCTVPASLQASKSQIERLQRLYQQQLVTLDRIRSLGLFVGIARSVILRRR